MRSFRIFIAVVCLGLASLITEAFITIKNEHAADKGFAVIELFTSEGCSSCPPADALVAKIQKENISKPVYILAYHVDYWNRLGWKDVFSSHEYSDRQNKYARWLKLSQIYTPQAIVNGRTELVGSEEGKLRNAIKNGLDKPAKTELSLNNVKIDNNKANIQYHVEGIDNSSALIIALIEKNATTKVERGENAGHTLSHVQIVTQLRSVTLKNSNSGIESITLPHSFDSQKYEMIGFIQNTATGEITGAAKAAFPQSLSTDKAK